MAEECPTSEIPTIKEDDAPMVCEKSEPQSMRTDDSSSDRGALTLPLSGTTSAATSTPVSDSECTTNPEDASATEGILKLSVSAPAHLVSESECTTSPGESNLKEEASAPSVSKTAAASDFVSDSECATSVQESRAKEESLTLPISGAASAAVSDSEVAPMNPDNKPAEVAAEPPGSPEPGAEAAVSGSAAADQEIMSADKVAELLSPDKEKVGIFKGVKTAIKTTVKSVWKKLSPKKPEKAALAASTQEESADASAPETEKKPYKVITYVSATRSGSLVLNSVASDEVTLDTDLPTSVSDVFSPDQESIATCDSLTHASRLPSLGESAQASPDDDAKESSGDRHDDAKESSGDLHDDAKDDGNVEKSSKPID